MAPLKPVESLYSKAKRAMVKMLDKTYMLEVTKAHGAETYRHKIIEMDGLKQYFHGIPYNVNDDFLRTFLSEERYSPSDIYHKFYSYDVALLFANSSSQSVVFSGMIDKHIGMWLNDKFLDLKI